jgi:uncharacterized repeat protein (TIGR03806 family)
VQLTRVFNNLSFSDPIWMGQLPGVPGYWYVAEQQGRIYRFVDGPTTTVAELVLDIRGPVSSPSNEEGLLGVAFHPDFASNGRVFLYYTGAGQTSVLSEFTSSDGGATIDPASESELVSVSQPYWNHNGGALDFGPDGLLYWGLGDGGSGGDPGDRAQDVNEWFGKVHRIDIDSGSPYGIPSDNPFASGGGRAEIYAWGLRNPWRFSFDSATGQLWLGDVGQNDWEEVDQIALGGNYGWNVMEGNACYSPSSGCNTAGLLRPHATYSTGPGDAVIGGVVYYGAAISELNGVYLYIDNNGGELYGLFYDPVSGLPAPSELVNTTRDISHFATGLDGEVYLTDYGNGQLYQMQRAGTAQVDTFPQTLSATGCFSDTASLTPVDGLIPYAPSHAFWSDDADKGRWLAIPDGTTIAIGADGDWELPIGSVTVKHFDVAGQPVETRLMVRHDDGEWGGYAYAWDADGLDATLLAGGLLVDLPGQTWSVPTRNACMQCHTVAAGGTLGLETAQLNVMGNYPSTGRSANQVATLDHIGLFADSPGDPSTLPVLPGRDAGGGDEEMARAWLHTNCSQCHRPDGPSRGDIDFRWDTALADMAACDVVPMHGDLGVGASARVLAAGDAASSIASVRAHRRDAYQMPPIGTDKVDTAGAAWLDGWIGGLVCP